MRYILDERVGCAAVIDTKHPDYDPEYPGLHSDTKGVVLYEAFTNKSNLNISEYEIEEGRLVVERLKKDCKTLNDTAPRTKTEFVKCEFSHAWEAVKEHEESKNIFHCNEGGEYAICGYDMHIIGECISDGELYRKVETEIDERQEFIDTACETLDDDEGHAHYSKYFGQLFDSGKFKLVE